MRNVLSILGRLVTFALFAASAPQPIVRPGPSLPHVVRYDLNLSVSFDDEYLKAVARCEVRNDTDATQSELPFLLYRLMRVTSVQINGKPTVFHQEVVCDQDFSMLQVNLIRVR